MRVLQRLYRPVLRWALDHRVITLSGALVLFGGAVVLASGIGSEFMPPLNEGDAARPREVTVAATHPWTDAEIIVKKGEMISFAAAGQIHWGNGADETSDADGDRKKFRARVGAALVYPIRGMGAGGLIARVGNGKPFKIGAVAKTLMPDSGELYLGINDIDFSNNSGEYHVTITRSSP